MMNKSGQGGIADTLTGGESALSKFPVSMSNMKNSQLPDKQQLTQRNGGGESKNRKKTILKK